MGMGCTNMLSQSQLSKIKMLASRPDICKRNSHLKLCYNLRNRNVFVPNTNKPQLGPLHTNKPQLGSLQYKKGKEHVYDVSGQTPTCAKDEYEMVKALDSVSSFFNGVWVHVNFLAKLKGATQCPDLGSQVLPRSPEATPIRGCGICLNNAIYYPAAGGHRGDRKSVCQMHTLWRSSFHAFGSLWFMLCTMETVVSRSGFMCG
uniref:Uncharacterized protein n=1 Tax=Oryza rufipogon TaxID=4529 RepID=A0A0E0NTR9_ORYRU